MKKQLIKIPALLLALVLVFPPSVFAVVPLAIPAAYWVSSLILHSAVAGAGIYYAMKSGSSSTVSSDGKVSRPSNAVWIDLTLPTPSVVEKNVTASKSMSQIKAAVDKSPSSYPNLSPTFHKTMPPLAVVGDVISTPYGNKTVTSVWSGVTSGAVQAMIVSTTTSIKYYVAGDQKNAPPGYTVVSYAYQYGYSSSVVATAPVNKTSLVVDATSADFKTSVAPSGIALSAYQAELDKAMQDDSYVPAFTDDTTGLPWAPPAGSSPATPLQVSAYNSGQAAKEAGDAAKTAADSAVNTAQTNYNNDPSSSNGQILADAKAKQAALTAEQAKDVAKDDQNVADSESLSGSGFSSGSAYGTKTDDELSLGLRFQSFVTDMKNTAVFSLPNQFLGNIPTSSNSVMTFNGGRYGQHSFDFASLSLLWIALKTVVLVMFGWFSIRIVTLKGGGG